MIFNGIAALLASVSCVMGTPGAWSLQPKYGVGQELTYEGKIREVRESSNVQSESELRLVVKALVLEKSSDGVAAIGCCTVHKPNDPKVGKPNHLQDALAMSFDEVRVRPSGAATWAKRTDDPIGFGKRETGVPVDLSPAAEMTSTRELGFLVEFPTNPVKTGEKWVIRPDGQPGISCQVVGMENMVGTKCVLVSMHQESQNWDNSERAASAWCMDASVWVDEKSRTVFKVERTTQLQHPGLYGEKLTRTVSYEQATNIRYHGELMQRQIEDYRTVAEAYRQLESARVLAQKSDRDRELSQVRRDLEAAKKQLTSTTYRPAIERLDKMAESMMEMETVDEEPVIVLASRREVAIGEKAPHFVVRNAKTDETISRKTTRGTPVVLVYIDPASDLSQQALRAVTRATEGQEKGSVLVLAVCSTIDDTTESMLHEKVPGEYTICTGGGADGAYGMEGTPHVVVIDGDGTLCVNQMGFGPDLGSAVAESLRSFPVQNIADEKDKKKSFLR